MVFADWVEGCMKFLREPVPCSEEQRDSRVPQQINQPYISRRNRARRAYDRQPSPASSHQFSENSCSLFLQDLAVLIPAYNEALVIGSVVLQTLRYTPNVIVIDDGSWDNTAVIAERAGATVLRMGQNQGKAHAIMEGFAYAREQGFEIIAMLDGDGQHDPEDLPLMVLPVRTGAADMVIGSRYLLKNNSIPPYRMAGQWVLNEFTRILSHVKISDTQSGFRVLGKRALDNLDFCSTGYNIESDMITHFARHHLRMVEIPISVTYDVPNKHKMNPLYHGVGVLKNLLCQITRQISIHPRPSGYAAMGIAVLYAGYLFSGLAELVEFPYHFLTIGMFTVITGSYGIAYTLRHIPGLFVRMKGGSKPYSADEP